MTLGKTTYIKCDTPGCDFRFVRAVDCRAHEARSEAFRAGWSSQCALKNRGARVNDYCPDCAARMREVHRAAGGSI